MASKLPVKPAAVCLDYLDQPGIFEKRCISPPSCTHRCALSQKSCIAGFTQLESPRVPEVIIAMPGIVPVASAIDEPHSGRNRRSTNLPVSPVLL